MNFDFLNRLQPLALLLLRLVLGAILIAHGYRKVFGGFHHHMEFVGSLGLPGLDGLPLHRYGVFRRDCNHPGIIHAVLLAGLRD